MRCETWRLGVGHRDFAVVDCGQRTSANSLTATAAWVCHTSVNTGSHTQTHIYRRKQTPTHTPNYSMKTKTWRWMQKLRYPVIHAYIHMYTSHTHTHTHTRLKTHTHTHDYKHRPLTQRQCGQRLPGSPPWPLEPSLNLRSSVPNSFNCLARVREWYENMQLAHF